MCIKSEQQMRQQVSKKRSDLEIPIIGTAMEGEIETNNAGSYPLTSLQPSSTHQNLEHSSIQESLLKTTEQMIKPEAAETSDDDIDKLLEDCRDAEGNFSEFLKNEPNKDDEPDIEYSNDGTTNTTISEKGEQLSIEFEEQQINETNVKKHHSRHAADDKPYKCPYCRRKFNTISNMYQHKARHEVACDICGKTIVKCHLKTHKLTHSNEKAHKCDFCGKRFNRITSLRNHIRTHTGEKPYKCKYCDRSFSDCSSRINHMRVHLGDNIHRCKLCPLAFPLAKELRAHLTEHDNDDSGTRERNMKALKEAEAKLQPELSKYETQHPPKEQSQQQYEMPVQKDQSTHGEDQPYKCPYCTRKFNTISNMYQHKALHEVTCDICGKCIVKTCLKNHKLTHSNEKAHKCDFCGKRFNLIRYLHNHIRTHTGEKPYKCKYCESSFSDWSSRRKHIRIHLGDNVHRCELCPLAFPLAKELRAHLTEHDNDDSGTRERNMKALKEAEAKLQLELSKKDT